MKPIYLLLSISLLLAACASPIEDASQGIEPTVTVTIPPSPTATIVPSPTPSPAPTPISMEDIEGMSDEERTSLVEGYDNYNKIASTIIPTIVILDNGTSYQAYNIQTGEVTSLDDAGIAVFRAIDGSEHLETKLFTALDEAHKFISVDEGAKQDNNYIRKHEGAYRMFSDTIYVESYIDYGGENLTYSDQRSFPVVGHNGELPGFGIVAREFEFNGKLSTLVVFVDREDNLQVIFCYGVTIDQWRGLKS